jgi:hypothetical protein
MIRKWCLALMGMFVLTGCAAQIVKSGGAGLHRNAVAA